MTDPLDLLDRALVAWVDGPGLAAAVRATVARHGYAEDDVEVQLQHVVERCRAEVLREVVVEELGEGDDALEGAPATVLCLASGNVPGLAIEGVCAAAAVGARSLVRRSAADTTLGSFLEVLRGMGHEAETVVEVVRDPLPWQRADAAIVFGTDATIELVRGRLRPDAAARMAAYGSRQGICVVDADAELDPDWAVAVADDVLTFRQRGCMSPSWVFLLGEETAARRRIDELGRALALARGWHVAGGVDDRISQRHATDADVLGAIAAGLAPDSRVLYAGDAQLTVVPVADHETLRHQVSLLGELLQTAVLAADDERFERLALLLTDTGCSRVCVPGEAHFPEPMWPQDGLGRVAPLLGRRPLGQ